MDAIHPPETAVPIDQKVTDPMNLNSRHMHTSVGEPPAGIHGRACYPSAGARGWLGTHGNVSAHGVRVRNGQTQHLLL